MSVEQTFSLIPYNSFAYWAHSYYCQEIKFVSPLRQSPKDFTDTYFFSLLSEKFYFRVQGRGAYTCVISLEWVLPMSMGLGHRRESFQASLNVHSGCFDNVSSRSLNSCVHSLALCLNKNTFSQNPPQKINATCTSLKNNKRMAKSRHSKTSRVQYTYLRHYKPTSCTVLLQLTEKSSILHTFKMHCWYQGQ